MFIELMNREHIALSIRKLVVDDECMKPGCRCREFLSVL